MKTSHSYTGSGLKTSHSYTGSGLKTSHAHPLFQSKRRRSGSAKAFAAGHVFIMAPLTDRKKSRVLLLSIRFTSRVSEESLAGGHFHVIPATATKQITTRSLRSFQRHGSSTACLRGAKTTRSVSRLWQLCLDLSHRTHNLNLPFKFHFTAGLIRIEPPAGAFLC